MDEIKAEPTQVKIKDMKVIKFIDERFIGLLEKTFENIKFAHICMFIPKEDTEEETEKEEKAKHERIDFTHITRKDRDKNLLTIDSEKPETLEKVLKVIEEYFKEGDK